MEQIKVTPEIVETLYKKLDNKQRFLTLFGTAKFYLVSTEFLNRIHEYLIKKVN
jgi:hypothetical protein